MKKKHRNSLHDYVAREVGQRIISGQWTVGEIIPADPELCEMLQVSRTALREAMIDLAAKGLIEARQKIGKVVRARTDWNMLDDDVLRWRIESGDADRVLVELYEFRRLIEPLAAALAAENATATDIERLRQAYSDIETAGDDFQRLGEPDARFHRSIIAASGNSLFASVGLVIASAVEANLKLVEESFAGHIWALPLHKSVLDAIEARNSNAARLAMQKLLGEAETIDTKAVKSRTKSRPAA
jgi:DNA-binding FadR family transcriptional regulator